MRGKSVVTLDVGESSPYGGTSIFTDPLIKVSFFFTIVIIRSGLLV